MESQQSSAVAGALQALGQAMLDTAALRLQITGMSPEILARLIERDDVVDADQQAASPQDARQRLDRAMR